MSWNAPENTGPAITDYDVRYREGTSGDWTNHTHNGVVTSTSITGLDSNTAYQAQVRASNDEGTGTWSDSGSGSTLTELVVSFGAAQYEVNESGSVDITLNITPAADRAAVINVNLEIKGLETGDYRIDGGIVSFASLSIAFASSQTSRSVTVSAEEDNDQENESIGFSFVNLPNGVTAGRPSTSTLTIRDNDKPDAQGAITLSNISPRVGSTIRATLSDPDGGVTGVIWQWQRSNDGSTWTDISSATAASYRAAAGDQGRQLRATAAYSDDHGPNKNAESNATNSVRPRPSPPPQPSPGPSNRAPVFRDGLTADRSVAENTSEGGNVGDPVIARDSDNDTLTYELSGAGASNFAVDGAGQISVAAGASLDHETEPSYSVRVTVSDGNGGTDTITVAIIVTDLDEPPGKPAPPTVEAADTDGHNSLTVSWNAPENTGPAITDYDVRYREGTSGDWTNHTHNGVVTSTSITGLDSNTAYQAQVRASNDEGTGTWSDSTTASTAVANLSVSLDSAGYTLAEGGDAATIMVRLDPAADRPVTLPILVTPLTAETIDYTVEGLTDGVLTFSRGEGTKSLAIRPNVDADTDDETVTLAFGTLPAFVTAGTLNMSSVTITDSGDPPVPGETPTPEASPNAALSQAVEEAEPGDDGFPGWAVAAIVVLAIGVTAGALLLVRVRRRLWPPEF